MARLDHQAELKQAATEQQFSQEAGLSTARLPDYSTYTSRPPLLLTDVQIQTFLMQGCLQLQPTLPADCHDRVYQGIDAVIGDGRATDNPGNNFLPLVPQMGVVFDDPVIRGALLSLLGPDYMLHPHRFCHDNVPGSGRQAWHHDTYWGYLRKVRNQHPWWVMIMYMPQDTPVERGPTGVLPGSQHLHKRFENAGDFELANAGPAGTCMLIHYDIWHHKLENFTALSRYMIKFEFVRRTRPGAPMWDFRDPAWHRPDGRVHYGLDPVWRHNWQWLTGQPAGFETAAAAEVGRLARKLATGDDAARAAAAERLGALGPGAAAAQDALEAAVADGHEPVSLNAAHALAALGEAGVAALHRVLRRHDGVNDADARLFFDEGQEWHIGHAVRSAAHGLIAAGAAAVPGLLALAGDGDELGRRYAAFALGEIADDRPAVRACLVRLTGDPNTHVRVSAIEALGLKAADDTTVAALCRILVEEPDDESRSNAALALWRIGPAAAKAVPALAAALHDGDRYVQSYALEALEGIATPDALAVLLPHLRTARWCPITNPGSMF